MPDLSVSMRGADKLDTLARKLRAAGRKDLDRELNRELRKPLPRLRKAVQAGIPAHMPRGYEDTLSRSLRFRLSRRRGAVISVKVTMHGRGGGGKDRDVRRLDRGILRHPVFGRRRRTTRGRIFNNPWVQQRVPPGFFTIPAERELDNVRRDMVAAIDRLLSKVEA